MLWSLTLVKIHNGLHQFLTTILARFGMIRMAIFFCQYLSHMLLLICHGTSKSQVYVSSTFLFCILVKLLCFCYIISELFACTICLSSI